MVDMKERLIEKIQKSVGGCARNWAEVIADALINDGLYLPPCKIGDTVYKIEPVFVGGTRKSLITPVTIVGFYVGEFPVIKGHQRKNKLIGYVKGVDLIIHLDMDQIGKTIFFSEADAEQASKEMMRNG